MELGLWSSLKLSSIEFRWESPLPSTEEGLDKKLLINTFYYFITIKHFDTHFKCLRLVRFSKEMYLFFPAGTNKIQSDSKTFIMLQKINISNKCYSFKLSIEQRILKKVHHIIHKILSTTSVFKIAKKNLFLNSKSYLNDFWRIMWHWSNDC